jgi:peptidoglycan/xylan/chitin deacetylase (PgdA/CDA1 family)
MTFDDGPDATWTREVLAELRRCAARATFFVLGERASATPELLARTVADGHEVALHGHRHVRHTDLSELEIDADTRAALAVLAEAGIRPTRWRTPWGICTPASVGVAERHGLELVHWTLDTHDWRGDSPWQMLSVAAREMHDEAVVLMHDALGPGAARTGCAGTVALISPLCALARARGLQPGSLRENARGAGPGTHAGSLRENARGAGAGTHGLARRLGGGGACPTTRAAG